MINSSRSFLLKWLNDSNIPIERIEDIGKGVALCMLLKKIDQNFPIFKQEPWNENDYLYNLKLVQLYLVKKGIKMYFPIEKMVKLKMQDNLEVIQSFYRHISKENHSFNNDSGNKNDNNFNSGNNSFNNDKNLTDKSFNSGNIITNSNTNSNKNILLTLKNERDFYYQKLIEIEEFIKENENENFREIKEKIFEILHK